MAFQGSYRIPQCAGRPPFHAGRWGECPASISTRCAHNASRPRFIESIMRWNGCRLPSPSGHGNARESNASNPQNPFFSASCRVPGRPWPAVDPPGMRANGQSSCAVAHASRLRRMPRRHHSPMGRFSARCSVVKRGLHRDQPATVDARMPAMPRTDTATGTVFRRPTRSALRSR